MTQQDLTDYRVELDGFCGPLDLLLYLVRRQEVEILDLPMAAITAQFVEFLDVLQVLDLDLIGEFVVVASTLVEIKSRMVLPQDESPPEIVERQEDPRSELVRQLLEYKQFKEAARLLEEQSAQWQRRYPRLSDDRPRGGGDPSQDLFREVELWDLVSALSRVLRKHTEAAPAKVIYDDTPIAVYIEQIKARVASEGRVGFSSFFNGTNSRSRIVGVFLAILELLRHQHFRAEQPEPHLEIWILPPLEQAESNPAPLENTGAPSEIPAEDHAAQLENPQPAGAVAIETGSSPEINAADSETPVIFRLRSAEEPVSAEEPADDDAPPATGTDA